MENKTISYLNSKPWYRSLKVIYFCLILICFGLAIVVNIWTGYYFYNIRQEYFREQVNINSQIQEVRNLKAAGNNLSQIVDKIIKPRTGYSPYVLKEIYGESDLSKLDFKLYDQNHKKPISISWLILIIPAVFAIAWLIPQIPKWIFYYIYLGTIKPKK